MSPGPAETSAPPLSAVVVDAPLVPSPPPPPPPLRGGLSFLLSGIGTAVRAPGVLLFLHLALLLAALPLALPVLDSAREQVASRSGAWLGAGDAFEGVPRVVLQEWFRHADFVRGALPVSLAPLLLLASLLGLGVAGGWMGLALAGRRERGLSVFLRSGGRYWFRFLRTWILGLAILYGLTRLVWGGPGERLLAWLLPGGETDPARMTSESLARLVTQGREAAYVLLVLVVELVLDLARATMVAGDGRSALLALFRGLGMLLRQPRRALAVVLGGVLLEAAWIAALVALAPLLPGTPWILVLVLPLGRIGLRGARLSGLVLLRRESTRRRSLARGLAAA